MQDHFDLQIVPSEPSTIQKCLQQKCREDIFGLWVMIMQLEMTAKHACVPSTLVLEEEVAKVMFHFHDLKFHMQKWTRILFL